MSSGVYTCLHSRSQYYLVPKQVLVILFLHFTLRCRVGKGILEPSQMLASFAQKYLLSGHLVYVFVLHKSDVAKLKQKVLPRDFFLIHYLWDKLHIAFCPISLECTAEALPDPRLRLLSDTDMEK